MISYYCTIVLSGGLSQPYAANRATKRTSTLEVQVGEVELLAVEFTGEEVQGTTLVHSKSHDVDFARHRSSSVGERDEAKHDVAETDE